MCSVKVEIHTTHFVQLFGLKNIFRVEAMKDNRSMAKGHGDSCTLCGIVSDASFFEKI